MDAHCINRLPFASVYGDYGEVMEIMDLPLEDRANRNVLVCGTSGSGKSELTNYLLLSCRDPRIVFNFKPGDSYLRLPYPIVHVADGVPDPFSDRESFTEAWNVAFPITSVGITAVQIPSLLRTAVSECCSFEDLEAHIRAQMEKSGRIQKDAWLAILSSLESIRAPVSGDAVVLSDVVLDLSGLNEKAKTFYAEFFLRQYWRLMIATGKRGVLCVDEVHRLARVTSTVIYDIMRQIRAYGAVWSATQNLSDIPDDLRNQFASILLFGTIHQGDLETLDRMGSGYSWTVQHLPAHAFVDLRADYTAEMVMPIYRLDLERVNKIMSDSKVLSVVPTALDIASSLESILWQSAVLESDLARTISRRFGLSHEVSTRYVRTYLSDREKAGKLRKAYIDWSDSDLWYAAGSNLTGLHDWIQSACLSILKRSSVTAAAVTVTNLRVRADIETPAFDVEVETGLKNDYARLISRIRENTRTVYIVLPNDSALKRYIKHLGGFSNVQVLTLKAFSGLFSGVGGV